MFMILLKNRRLRRAGRRPHLPPRMDTPTPSGDPAPAQSGPSTSGALPHRQTPVLYKRLRPFKESAAQQRLKPAMAGLKPFQPQAPQGPPFQA